MSQLVITAVGPDRPGIVDELTGLLADSGGNILDSRWVNLRGQFALVILLECPFESAGELAKALPAKALSIGLTLNVSEQSVHPKPVEGVPYRLKTYSMDRPGIVHRITHLLRAHSVNIEDLSTRQESAPFAGSPLFLMEARLTVPASVALRTLRRELETICDELNCDVDLEPA